MESPYSYVEGENEWTVFQTLQGCCGGLIGSLGAWIPCFCCCFPNPYKKVDQGSKGLLLRYKRYIRTLQPGLYYVNPVTQAIITVDCRIAVIDLPKQRLMTKDNISISIDSCCYYMIKEPHIATFRIQNLDLVIAKACGGIIKNTVSQFTFQELLQSREKISNDIEEQIKPIILHWGVQIQQIYLKDYSISQDLERELVSAPIARRDAESKIINAQGDVEVARLLSNRSKILDSQTAIQVRYLETIKSLARNESSTMMYTSF